MNMQAFLTFVIAKRKTLIIYIKSLYMHSINQELSMLINENDFFFITQKNEYVDVIDEFF